MSTYDSTAPKPDVYARVTSQIVNAIEQGTGNWRMPWHTSGRFAFSPINAVTHKPYRGVNVLALWAVARSKGYERGECPRTRNGRNGGRKSARYGPYNGPHTSREAAAPTVFGDFPHPLRYLFGRCAGPQFRANLLYPS
jgi:hypothetical protein